MNSDEETFRNEELADAYEVAWRDFLDRKAEEPPRLEDYLRDLSMRDVELVKRLRELEAEYARHERRDFVESPSVATANFPAGYEKVRELGRGAMGVVYEARQSAVKNRRVALKLILPATEQGGGRQDVDPGEAARRLGYEVEALTRLHHPNIVTVYEVGSHGGHPFFSMELIDGNSLKEFAAGKPMDSRRAAGLLAAVARAIQHAHDHRVFHRDLKPANILIDRTGKPYVVDFGLAKFAESKNATTKTNATPGTLYYMSPEQTDVNQVLTNRTDIFSLGVVLYELLAGRRPFEGQSILEVVQQICERAPTRPSSLVKKVPRDLETICLKCLRKEPGGRYASAAELADDLQSYLDGQPIKARPVGSLERLVKLARRRPLAASLVATIVLVGVVSGFGLYRAWDAAEKAREDTAKGLDRLETTVAEKYARLLEVSPRPDLRDVDTLRELAALPGDKIWRRFLEIDLETPARMGGLQGRADMLMTACVGMNSRRRKQAFDLLGSRLEDQSADDLVVLKCAKRLAQLEPEDGAQSSKVAAILMRQIAQARVREEVEELTSALTLVLGRMQPVSAQQVAAEAAELLLAKIDKSDPRANIDRHDPRVASWHSRSLAAVAVYMEPRRASLCLFAAMVVSLDASEYEALATGLTEVLLRMESGAAQELAGEIAGRFLREMQNTHVAKKLSSLAAGLAVAAARMERKAAQRHAGDSIRRIVDRMKKSELDDLRIIDEVNESELEDLPILAHSFAKLAAWTEVGATQKLAGKAADRFLDMMSDVEAVDAKFREGRGPLTNESYSRKQRLYAPIHMSRLMPGLAALLPLVEQKRAEELAASIDDRFLHRWNWAVTAGEGQFLLLEALGTVAERLEREAAQRLVGKWVKRSFDSMRREKNDNVVRSLVVGLGKLVNQTGPGPGQQLGSKDVQPITDLLDRTKGPYELSELATSLGASAGWMEQAVAERLVGKTAERLLVVILELGGVPNLTVDDGRKLLTLADGLGALAERMNPEQVTQLTDTLIGKGMRDLAIHIAGSLANQLEPQRSASLILAAMNTRHPDDWRRLGKHLAAVALRMDDQGLVDLLKDPCCVGEARAIILRALSRNYKQQFHSLWQFVEWAERDAPNLDLRSAPVPSGR